MEIYFECGKVAVLKESQDNLNHYTADLIILTDLNDIFPQ